MRLNSPSSRVIALVLFPLSFVSMPSHGAQTPKPSPPPKTVRAAPPDSPRQEESSLLARELGETVALLPWSYKNGKDVALQSAREEANQLLLDTGFNVFLVKTTTGSMPPPMPNTNARRTASPFNQILDDGLVALGKSATTPSKGLFVLPTVEQMLEIGDKLQTRYVLAGRAQWSSRNVWIGISNRVKSICTVDVLIVDTTSRQLVLDARNVMGDSTEQKNMYNSVTNAITLNPLPLVMPGSVTPQEQNAVVIATAKAMKPWILSQRVQAAIVQADRSAELSADDVGGHKFSTLISPVAVLHATLHVSGADQKQLSAVDPDLARIMAFHEVGFDYLKPGRLLLTATTPKQEQVTLQVDGDTERLSAGPNYKPSVQNLADAPARRLSLLDFCGLLTRDLFEYSRARFVRPESREGVNLVVYDLSYWGSDDGSYERVWLDPAKRLAVKREVYDRSGKLKAVFTYSKPKEVAPDIWAPERVDVKNGALKPVISVAISQVTVERESSSEESAATEIKDTKPAEKAAISTDREKQTSREALIDLNRKLLSGTWQAIGFDREGDKATDDQLKDILLVFDRDGGTQSLIGGKVFLAGPSTIDPTQSPMTLDVTYTEGVNKGRTSLGIYKIEDGILTICRRPPDKPRPVEFTSNPDNGTILIRYKRQKIEAIH